MQVQLNTLPRITNFRQNKEQITANSQNYKSSANNFKPVNPKLYQVYFAGGMNAVEKLPAHIKEVREATIKEAIDFITSKAFYEDKIEGKNWKNAEYVQKMIALSKDPQALRQRADLLLTRAEQALGKAYEGKRTIVIPWSGGRDSSTLLSESLAFFPDKKYKLLTVLNGMTKEIENPIIQYKRLLARLDRPEKPIDVQHYYIDCVDDMKKHVVETALDDRKRLGSPALCSSCKMVMEKALGNVAQKYDSKDIMLGYTKYQGVQDWVEQTPEQIRFITEELAQKSVHTHSPLYDVLEYPFDPILSLSSLGIPMREHKIEMKCRAGGLNPQDLNKTYLMTFLAHKNWQTNHVFGTMQKVTQGVPTDTERFQSLIPDIEALRANKPYRDGIFEEKKYHGT